MAKSIMILSSTSGAGKSFFAAALCRIFAEDGYKTAPFKIQSVTSEVSVSEDGLEISADVALLAAASLKSPESRMNPVILEPCGEGKFDVTVMGILLGEMAEKEYSQAYPDFEDKVYEAYESLLYENDVVIVEADGNPAEPDTISQNSLSFARHFRIPIILVSDFETGCAFSSAYGVFAFMDSDLRDLLKGFVINKAGGIFLNGENNLEKLRELTEVPFVGIIPLADVKAPPEELQVYSSINAGSSAEDPAVSSAAQNYENIEDIEDIFPSFEAGGEGKAREIPAAPLHKSVLRPPKNIERISVSTVEELEEEIAILKASIEMEESQAEDGLQEDPSGAGRADKKSSSASAAKGIERDSAVMAGGEKPVRQVCEQKAENFIKTENDMPDNVARKEAPIPGKDVPGGYVEDKASKGQREVISDMPAKDKKSAAHSETRSFTSNGGEKVSSGLKTDPADVSASEELDRILAMGTSETDKRGEDENREDVLVFPEEKGFAGVMENEGGSPLAENEFPLPNSSTIADNNHSEEPYEKDALNGKNKDVLDEGCSAYTEDKENSGDVFSFGDIFESEMENVSANVGIVGEGVSSERGSFKRIVQKEDPADGQLRVSSMADKNIPFDSSLKEEAVSSRVEISKTQLVVNKGGDSRLSGKASAKTVNLSEQTDSAQHGKGRGNPQAIERAGSGVSSVTASGATAAKVYHDPDKVNVTVIALPHMTHGAALKFLRDDTMRVAYCNGLENFGEPDIVLLPDTLKPISDFLWMKGNGLEKAVRDFAGSNGLLLGICGGYHMLFEAVADPYKMETGGETAGFGFFKAKTTLGKDRKISKARGIFKGFEGIFSGFNGKNFEGWYVQSARISRSNHKHIAVIIDQHTGIAKQDGLYNKNVFGMDVSGFLENKELKEMMINVLTRFKQARKVETGKVIAFAEKGEAKLSINPREAADINEKLVSEDSACKGEVSGDLSEPEGILNEEDYIFGVPKGYSGFSTSHIGDVMGFGSDTYDFFDQEDDHYILTAHGGNAPAGETFEANGNVLELEDIPAVAQIVRRSIDIGKIYEIIEKKPLR